jgi:small GTP-binding protein
MKSKLILIGDSGVGKTSLIRRLVENQFIMEYNPTIGVNLFKYTMQVENEPFFLLLWDIAGQSKFDSLHKFYYQGSSAIMVVFDLTREDSFQNLRNWYQDILNNNLTKQPIVLVGNKADLTKIIKISPDQIKQIQTELHISQYVETSALNGQNVRMAFEYLAKQIKKEFQIKMNM